MYIQTDKKYKILKGILFTRHRALADCLFSLHVVLVGNSLEVCIFASFLWVVGICNNCAASKHFQVE